jgi:hypothetical protein
LPAWSSCRGPRRSAASELAVAPSARPGSPSSNAWPARPRHASSRHILGPALLRALHCVPSGMAPRAYLRAPCPATPSVSVLLLKTDSKLLLGTTVRLMPRTPTSMSIRPLPDSSGSAGDWTCLLLFAARGRRLRWPISCWWSTGRRSCLSGRAGRTPGASGRIGGATAKHLPANPGVWSIGNGSWRLDAHVSLLAIFAVLRPHSPAMGRFCRLGCAQLTILPSRTHPRGQISIPF